MQWVLVIFAIITLIGAIGKDETPVRITFGILTGILLAIAAALHVLF